MKLHNYEGVGSIVYSKLSSLKAESKYVTQVTILQLLTSNIISLHIEESESPTEV